MTRPPVDPDLVQAVADLTETAGEHRVALRQIVAADRDDDDRLYARASFTADDTRGVVDLRAGNRGWKPEALMAVLQTAVDLKAQYRRRPSLADIERGLERDAVAQRERAMDLRARAVAAERRAADAEKSAASAAAGLALFGVYL